MEALAFFSFIRAHWRVLAPLAVAAIVLGSLAYARHETDVAHHAKETAKVAEKQSQNTDNALKAAERVIRTETVIREQVDHTVATIQHSEGSNDPLPPDLRDSLCTGLGELRHGAVCKDYSAADPTRPVPGA